MRTLGIDTTARRGGAAVVVDGEIVASRSVETSKGFGELLYPLIHEVLAAARLRLDEIELFAAASGPGSFTGVRIGLTAVKALGEALGRPAVGVSNLEALGSLALAGSAPACAVLLDARRGEIYGAAYGAALETLVEPTVERWETFRERAARFDPVWVSIHSEIFEPAGAAPLGPEARWKALPDVAAAAAMLASRREGGGAGRPEAVDANYIRRPDAERNWKRPV